MPETKTCLDPIGTIARPLRDPARNSSFNRPDAGCAYVELAQEGTAYAQRRGIEEFVLVFAAVTMDADRETSGSGTRMARACTTSRRQFGVDGLHAGLGSAAWVTKPGGPGRDRPRRRQRRIRTPWTRCPLALGVGSSRREFAELLMDLEEDQRWALIVADVLKESRPIHDP